MALCSPPPPATSGVASPSSKSSHLIPAAVAMGVAGRNFQNMDAQTQLISPPSNWTTVAVLRSSVAGDRHRLRPIFCAQFIAAHAVIFRPSLVPMLIVTITIISILIWPVMAGAADIRCAGNRYRLD